MVFEFKSNKFICFLWNVIVILQERQNELGISQPALTTFLNHLENGFGCKVI